MDDAEFSLTGLIQATRQLLRHMREEWYSGADLTLSQVSVLARLDRTGERTTADLARAEAIKPQSMGTALAELERKALVSRAPHPTDRRQVLFAITDAGRTVRGQATASKQKWIGYALQLLMAQERDTLDRAAGIIRRLDRP